MCKNIEPLTFPAAIPAQQRGDWRVGDTYCIAVYMRNVSRALFSLGLFAPHFPYFIPSLARPGLTCNIINVTESKIYEPSLYSRARL